MKCLCEFARSYLSLLGVYILISSLTGSYAWRTTPCSVFSGSSCVSRLLNRVESRAVVSSTALHARAAKPEPAKKVEVELLEGGGGPESEDEEMITVPYNGLIGSETGQLFQKPLEEFDAAATPTKNTEDLPGRPGSEERNDAIVARIRQRVEDLKKQDEWTIDDQDFGKNPLQNVPLTEVMIQQLKVIRPFESFSEFVLTLVLLVFTTSFLTVFINFNNDVDERFINWWAATDFDLLSGIIRES